MLDSSLSLSFAMLMGVVTFFSPCAYPLLPGYVGFYVSQTDGADASLSGSVSRGLVAGAGVLGTFGVLFAAAYWVGHSTLSNITVFEPLVGLILVVFGLVVALDRGPSLSVTLPKRRSSVFGFGIFGAGYALAAAGCVAPIFIAVVAQALALPPLSAALFVGTYVGSVVVLMISLTVATGMGLVASAGRLAAHGDTLKRVAGAVMIVAGFGQLYVAFYVDVV